MENYIQAEKKGDYRHRLEEIHQRLQNSKENQSDLLGWYHYPLSDHRKMLKSISDIAQKIKMNTDITVVIGMGGSFFGSGAVRTAFIT